MSIHVVICNVEEKDDAIALIWRKKANGHWRNFFHARRPVFGVPANSDEKERIRSDAHGKQYSRH